MKLDQKKCWKNVFQTELEKIQGVNVMDYVIDIVKTRRSIRRYKRKSLRRDTIDSILDAARCAPTAEDLQQLDYKVITNRVTIKRISNRINSIMEKENQSLPMNEDPNVFYGAPLLIIITGPGENIWIYSDAALAIQNIMLYATSIDLGTCFIGKARYVDKDEELLRELHISKGRKIVGAVICGYADETPEEKERKMRAEFFT
jgi:nitroreductase